MFFYFIYLRWWKVVSPFGIKCISLILRCLASLQVLTCLYIPSLYLTFKFYWLQRRNVWCSNVAMSASCTNLYWQSWIHAHHKYITRFSTWYGQRMKTAVYMLRAFGGGSWEQNCHRQRSLQKVNSLWWCWQSSGVGLLPLEMAGDKCLWINVSVRLWV